MSKLDIPVFRYLAQDEGGSVYCFLKIPRNLSNYWNNNGVFEFLAGGEQNPD